MIKFYEGSAVEINQIKSNRLINQSINHM